MAIPHPSTFEYEVVTVDRQGKVKDRQKRQAEYRTEALGKEGNLELVMIPDGRFQMGAPESEGDDEEHPQHPVTVESFWMGKYPVTQAQWKVVASFPKVKRDLDPDPSRYKGDNRPVEFVTWYDAEEFCQRLSKKTGRKYRLPSEAEWEYACRAGTTTPCHFGETITTDLANYDGGYTYGAGPKGEYRGQTTPVGSFKAANGFGLYDMHGNVWEWCLDPWHENYEGAPTDGSAWVSESRRNRIPVRKSIFGRIQDLIGALLNRESLIGGDDSFRRLHGGSWTDSPRDCRSAYRVRAYPCNTYSIIGFRVVCAP